MTSAPRLASRVTAARAFVDSLLVKWRARSERAWVGLIGVPLAQIATGLLDEWWTWIVLTAAAWACTPKWRWSWLLSLELGFVGTMWAAAGATALAHFPDHLLLVGVLWASFPVALAVVGAANRRRASRPESYYHFQ